MRKQIILAIVLSSMIMDMGKAQNKVESHTIDVNGISLHYKKYGKGKPLLLLHGWTQTSGFWQPYMDQYADGYEVYALDLRGHGRSSPLTDDFTIQKAAQDVKELIWQLKLGHVKAMGLSFGGLILLEIANTDKSLIESMVLIGTSNTYNGKESQRGKPVFTFESMNQSFQLYLKQQHHHGENQIKALFNPNLDYQINIGEDDLKQIQSKVLIINGDSDEQMGIQGAIIMHQNIPDASLWIIPDTGHLAISEESKEEFMKITEAFFRK